MSSVRQGDETTWLVQTDSMAEVAELELAGGEAAAITRVGPGDNRKNEDAAAIVAAGPASALLAVADGFGGAPAGERASWLAASEVAGATLGCRSEDRTIRAAVLDGFEAANRKILELGIGAATTLAAVGIEDGAVRPFHSGDSTILIVGGRGKIKWRSVAHSPAGYAVASGWIAEREARRHDEAQMVSNYLGSPEMRIEVGPDLRLAPRDTVLLASDGLTDNLRLQAVAEIVVRAPSLAVALAELAERARTQMATAQGKPDDLTAIAFRRRSSARSK
ncbi:MAG: SpoIIE family protein phosphatase [bacterium]|nr:SpoIIE family protein phosphatase [bacterium]